MKKSNLILLLIIASIGVKAQSQEIVFSNLPKDAIKQSEKTIQRFFKAHNNRGDIAPYLTPNEANFGGAIWLGIDEFKGMISQLLPKPVNDFEFNYYTIEDIENDPQVKDKAIKLNRVFNNYCVFADGNINDQSASIVLQVRDKKMKIYSIALWNIGLAIQNQMKIKLTDTLNLERIALKIPKGFEEPIVDENFTSFVFPGNTERDAIIQVMNNQNVADLNIYTYMWAEHITSSYRRSDFEISYIDEGYMIKYEMLDENDVLNQGITVGIEHNDKLILIQYFGFKETYDKHWKEVDDMIRNILKL